MSRFLSFHFCLTALGQTAEEHYKQASDLYDKKDFASAITRINKALQKDSTNARYLLLKGNATMNVGGKDYPMSPGDFVFAASHDFHGIRNSGKGQCEYFAFQWR